VSWRVAYWSHPISDFRSRPTAAEKANAALHKLDAHTSLFAGQNQGVAAQDSSAFPGASVGFTSRAVVIYSDLG
jgi:hypothetical protein